MAAPPVSIPRPCPESWDAMTPTDAGRHCAKCQTEVVDFTRMSAAEVLAYLEARKGERVCAFMAAPAVQPVHAKRRWLLALAAFFGLHLTAAEAKLPQLPPAKKPWFRRAQAAAPVVIRGVVLDDSLNVPIEGARVFVKETKYGAVTNQQGEFTLVIPADWEPVKNGTVKLEVESIPFALWGKTVEVEVGNNLTPPPLTLRLKSVPQRGFYKGKLKMRPVPLPIPQPRKRRR